MRPLRSRFLSLVQGEYRLAWRNVLRHRRRTAVAISAVAAGIVAMLLAAGFIEWIYWAMREDTIRSRLGHAQVVRKGYFEAGAADPFSFLLPEATPERQAVERTPGVLGIMPRLGFNGLVSLGDATLSFLGEGIDPAAERPFSDAVVITRGEGLSGEDAGGIIMGQGLADNLGAQVGDTVVLVANTRSGGINAVEVRVRGVFSTPTKAYDDAALRMPLATAQQLLRTTGAHVWVLMFDDTLRAPQLASDLQSRLGASGLQVVTWYELADWYNKTVVLFSKQVMVMKLIIAVIIILSISNTLTMSVLERTSEIGTSMALGATRTSVRRQFIGEGVMLGIAGGVLGVTAGLAMASVISAIGIPLPPPPGMARALVGEVRVTGGLVLEALILAILTTLLASLYPAWKASRMDIVDALRHSR